MAAKLLVSCAETALHVNCAETKLLTDCGGVLKIVYSWTGGYDLFTETTFLGNSLGWFGDGPPKPYMVFADYSVIGTPPTYNNGSGHEDYTIRVDDALADGAWNTVTVVVLEADWYFRAGTALTVTATYNGVTQVKVISPSSITVLPSFSPGPSPIVSPVGAVTVRDNGTFTLA